VNTAKKQELMWDFPITHCVTTKKGLKPKFVAVSVMFAVVELRF